MLTYTQAVFSKSALCLAISSILYVPSSLCAEESELAGIEVINVTGSRRASSVQDTPLNISALNDTLMKRQNINSPEDVARWVPGLTISEQGGREEASIVVRGLNTNSSGRLKDGGTVATYLGEIAFGADIRLVDVERVEVLIGPQGTLYGAGTMAGAIRYILNDADLNITEGQVSGDIFALNESSGAGSEFSVVFNTPIIEDELAIRFNINRFNTPGYVDYNYVLKEVGVSQPDPDWNDATAVAQNLRQVADANDETTTTGRVSLRWQPNDWFDGTLNYFYQRKQNGGNSVVQYDALSLSNPLSPFVGRYESTKRFEEPNERKDSLLSLEIEFDLGFADLVSATGSTKNSDDGNRDQTDLLMNIYTGYADFPAFTRDRGEVDELTQELRLVSTGDAALSWIAGYYYNKTESEGDDREYTTGLTDAWFGGEYVNIETDLEYIDITASENTEQALYGELTYQLSKQWDITLGARYYEYDLWSKADNHAPFFDGEIASIDELVFQESTTKGDGSLFKFNTGYQINDDILVYATISEGFRLGGANGLPSCDGSTQVCALPNEEDYQPDKTTNTELGIKSALFDNQLHLNAALFNIDWDDAQISAVTLNGAVAIISNAGSANSKGIEFSARGMLSNSINTYVTYSYAKAELTEDSPFLFGVIGESGTALQDFHDGQKGDRLPGAPEHQVSMGLTYETEVFGDKWLNVNYGLTAQSDVYTKVGLKEDGEILSGFALSNFSIELSDIKWSLTFYINNLFDKYAVTSVRRDKSWAGRSKFESQNKALPELQRTYGYYITQPRTIGLRYNYNFEW